MQQHEQKVGRREIMDGILQTGRVRDVHVCIICGARAALKRVTGEWQVGGFRKMRLVTSKVIRHNVGPGMDEHALFFFC